MGTQAIKQVKSFKDMRDMIYTNSAEFANVEIFAYGKKGEKHTVTFERFRKDLDALGTVLAARGYIAGKRIALVGENSYEWVLTYFTAVVGGNVILPLDKELKDAELCTLIQTGEADLLIYSGKKASVTELIGDLPSICIDDFKGLIDEGESLIASGNMDFLNRDTDIEKCCAVIFTSGTVGNPKGVMLSQKNLLSDALHSLEAVNFYKGTVNILPLNHTFGFMANILTQVWCAYPVYFNNDLKLIMHDIQEAKPGHLSVVPLFLDKFYKSIWRNAKKQGKDKILRRTISVSNALRKVGIDLRRVLFKSVIDGFGGNLRMIISGGAPMDKNLVKGFDDFGIEIVNGYGITECSPIVCVSNLCQGERLSSVGPTIPGTEVRIDEPNEAGEGEICLKGDIVMMGYYNDPVQTNECLIDGWFHTGDIGKVDDEGFVFITGRKKNMILLENGKNVYPEELEAEIGRIDHVDEVVVYVENNKITAEVYSETKGFETQIEADINKFNETLAEYKQIKKVKFRDEEFEKTTTKKIKRRK